MADTNNSDTDKTPAGPKHGVPGDVAKGDSPGGYGGDDRLQSEVGPLQPDAGRDQGKDI